MQTMFLTESTSLIQDIREEACYNSETDRIFIPFKDSNRLFNDVFQICVQKLFYRNISETMSYSKDNQINKTENFWGPSRIDVTVAYQDKNTNEPQAQTVHVELNPEQVKPCLESESAQLSKLSDTTLIIIYSSAGFISIIIIILLIIFFRRQKSKEPKTGMDTNPEYGADYYYKQNEETYGGPVQYVT